MSDLPPPLCSLCEKFPCIPKRRGQGMSIHCEDCCDKANARTKKSRQAKKAREMEKQAMTKIERQITEFRQEMRNGFQAIQAQLTQILRKL